MSSIRTGNIGGRGRRRLHTVAKKHEQQKFQSPPETYLSLWLTRFLRTRSYSLCGWRSLYLSLCLLLVCGGYGCRCERLGRGEEDDGGRWIRLAAN